ncbi:MAG TPA: thioesterase family protein [Bacteroidia bacterium]|jgi:acyl-CoA thioester hydrolase|nr:thioesterase family protein [Bacteroidia bacterium]
MAKKDLSSIKLSNYRYSSPVQVRFADIDKMGHVNNATVLTYFEIGRLAYFDEIIGRSNDWFGRGLILAHTEVDYIHPIFVDDVIKVYSRVIKLGGKSFEIENLLVKIKNGEEIFTSFAVSTIVCMNYKEKKTIPIPEEWKEKLNAFEQKTIPGAK